MIGMPQPEASLHLGELVHEHLPGATQVRGESNPKESSILISSQFSSIQGAGVISTNAINKIKEIPVNDRDLIRLEALKFVYSFPDKDGHKKSKSRLQTVSTSVDMLRRILGAPSEWEHEESPGYRT